MSRKCAVVLTYPAHFYQTTLTLRSIRQHLPTIDKITVLVDDFSRLNWPDYLDLCRTAYQPYDVVIVPTATMPLCNQFYKYPWVRQQMLKLHLDQVVDCPEWLFVDGDICLLSAPPESVRFCSRLQYQGRPLDQGDPRPGEKTSQTIFYVRHVFQDQYSGFYDHEGTYITASHPPVHDMTADLLRSLRSHVEQQHSNFAALHFQIAQDNRYSISEWELIEWYYQHYQNNTANWYFDQSWHETSWESDRELGTEWFEQRGLEIDPNTWSQLPLAKYL
jgi:hypothetical protein